MPVRQRHLNWRNKEQKSECTFEGERYRLNEFIEAKEERKPALVACFYNGPW